VIGTGGFREASLKEIFGQDLDKGADDLTAFLGQLGVSHRFADHKIPAESFRSIIDEAFAGERGKNFIGSKESFLEAADKRGVIQTIPAK
jgi:alcohol dehydrogenase YqhD (iron-dependent ADH family)